MNKRIALLFVLTALAAVNVFAQSGDEVRLLNVNKYSSYFLDKVKLVDDKYVMASTDEDYERIAGLSAGKYDIDTPLEIALLSYAAGVVNIRPVEADAVLPAGDRRLSGLRLGAAVYKELAELRFLSPRDTAAIGRYEGMLKFIGDNNDVTRAEIENYFRAGIRDLVSGIVAEEFNKISFMLDRAYNVTLIRDPQNGHYQLSYERPEVPNSGKVLNAQTLEALLSAMSKSKDFSREAVDAVRDQAYLLPAIVYADWRSKGIAGGVDALALVTDTLTEFYLNPNKDTYNAILGINARYTWLASRDRDIFAAAAANSINIVTGVLNPALRSKLASDISTGNLAVLMRVPSDRRFNIFSTRYSK